MLEAPPCEGFQGLSLLRTRCKVSRRRERRAPVSQAVPREPSGCLPGEVWGCAHAFCDQDDSQGSWGRGMQFRAGNQTPRLPHMEDSGRRGASRGWEETTAMEPPDPSKGSISNGEKRKTAGVSRGPGGKHC